MKTEILNLIQSSKVPVTRAELNNRFPIGDREIRELIAELQGEGFQIINLGKGYKIALNGELEQYIKIEKGRAISILVKLKHLQPKIADVINQLEMF